jgi:Uma2 family endonuclease
MAAELATQPKSWTYDDYSELRDDTRYEVIRGELLTMAPAPDTFHQEWLANLFLLLNSHVKTNKLGKVLLAPVDVILDEQNIVQPDLVFVSAGHLNLIQRRGIFGVPDLVVEIVSPFSVHRDRHEKPQIYAEFGIKELWIVDPGNHGIELFALKSGVYQLLSTAVERGKVRSAVLDLQFDIADVAPKAD